MGAYEKDEFSNHVPQLGRLAINCWCEQNIVYVPIELFKKNLTAPCKLSACKRLAESLTKT